IASGFPETRLLGSACAGAGHGPWDRMILISPSVKTGCAATSCCAGLVPAENAQAAAHAARIAISLIRPPCRSRRAIISSAPARRVEAQMKDSLMRFFAAAALLVLSLPCAAQSYPSKPILAVMPLQAGSAVDVMIRIVAQKMGENLGQQIVIENQPGAAGSIGAERVKRAAPDG